MWCDPALRRSALRFGSELAALLLFPHAHPPVFLACLLAWRSAGQMDGKLDKLQFVGLDSIMTGQLTTGKEDARALRKALNRRVGVLNQEIKRLHSSLGQQMFAIGVG